MADDAATAPKHGEAAGPWARFLAKRIDGLVVILLSMLVGMLLAAIDLFTGTALLDILLMSPPIVSFVANAVVTLLLWFAYDVVLLAAFGKTLGKTVMGVSVTQDGGRPGLGAVAKRSALVLPLGLGLGLPFLSLIGAIWGYVQVENRGSTVWDRISGTQVIGKAIGWWRWAIGILVWVGVSAVIVLTMIARLSAYLGQ